MRRSLLLIFSFVLSGVLPGCIHADPERIEASVVPVAAQPSIGPTLRTGDRLRITVFGEDKLSGDYDVDAAGSVALPLVGSARAAGLSTAALRDALTDRLRQAYLRDPKVTVDILSQRPFYILGEVEKPGEYPYRNGLDIWRAMALAGGQTYRASSSTVAIQRAGETEFHDFELAADVGVGPGDVVRVPQRWF